MGAIGKAVSGFGKSLAGGQGDYYKPQFDEEMYNLMKDESNAAAFESTPYQTDYLAALNAGGDGFSKLSGAPARMQRAVAESPIAGTLLAQDILQRGPISSMIYGKQGELAKALADVDAMRKPSAYGLQAGDQTAYGQMSGELARMFGQSEKGLASDLAARGLAGAESGVAGKAYSGLQGNKLEQFAGLQRQIADQAMQRAMQRDAMLRNYAMGMQEMSGRDIQNQFGRQLAGNASARGAISGAANLEQSQNQMKNQAQLASLQDMRSAYQPGLLDMQAAGMKNAQYNFAAAPGTAAQNFAGSFGSAAGGTLGGGMFGGGSGGRFSGGGMADQSGGSTKNRSTNPYV